MPQGLPKKSDRTRQFIIEKSAPIFNQKGFSGTSLQDIIEATGLTKGSIYGNFGGKDALALAVFDFNSRQILQNVRRITQSDQTAGEKLLAITEFYRSYLYRPELAAGCPILNTGVEFDDIEHELQQKALETLDYLRRSLVFILQEGVARNEIRLSHHPESLATILIALIEGGIFQTKLYHKSRYLLDCLAEVDRLVNEIKV